MVVIAGGGAVIGPLWAALPGMGLGADVPPELVLDGDTVPDVGGVIRPVGGAGSARGGGTARVGGVGRVVDDGAGGCVACGGVVVGGAGIAERGAGAVVVSPSPGVIGPLPPGIGIEGSGCDSVGGGAPGVVCAVSGTAATVANNSIGKAKRFMWASFPVRAPGIFCERSLIAFGCAAFRRSG